MTESSPSRPRATRALRHATLILMLCAAVAVFGCRPEPQKPRTPTVISSSHVSLLAYLDADSPCQQGTLRLLAEIESGRPERVGVTVVDINSPEGRRRWQEAGLDATAIAIDGNTTVAWGEGDARRIVSFVHPAGFAWTYNDLRAAVSAALSGQLSAADPAEAQGVRVLDVTVRGQSIRIGNEGGETGQLVIGEKIVLTTTASYGELGPGQRVSAAAETLNRVLEKPFTPNRLTLKATDDDVAVLAAGEQVIVATQADTGDEDISPEVLAERWRREVRQALILAALQRPETPPETELPPAPKPPSEPETRPDEALRNPLAPPT